jgi:hypothetical protein
MQKNERRTGALMFVASGAVCDDPLVFFEGQSRKIPLDLTQGNINSACNMP